MTPTPSALNGHDMAQLSRIYVSGPMTGVTDDNFPAFDAATHRLRDLGYWVENPTESPLAFEHHPWETYLRRDLTVICTCHALAVLPGWQQSPGARLEVAVAGSLKMPIYDAHTLERLDISVTLECLRREETPVCLLDPSLTDRDAASDLLLTALDLVEGPRQAQYDHPLRNFQKQAYITQAILMDKLQPGATITAEDCALLNALALKGGRLIHQVQQLETLGDYEHFKRDTLDDTIGYALTLLKVLRARAGGPE